MTWREASKDDRTVAWYWALSTVLLVAASPLAPLAAHFAPPCLWHAWTGLPCPTCGATRAIVRLSRLDGPGAIAFNPLVTLATLTFLSGGILAPAWLSLGGRVPIPASKPRPVGIAVVVVALALNWGWLVARGV